MADRPDIILIMTDQQRHDQVGYASAGYFETPNIDRLASAGAVFDNAYSPSTTCVPARVGLLTGLLHHRVPTQVNRFALREGFWTIAHALKRSGYETALFGKMHFYPVHSQHGFETMRLVEHLTAARVAAGERDDYHDWLAIQGLADWRPAFSPAAARSSPRFPYDAAVHPTGWIEQEVISFLGTRARNRPLLLVVSFAHPHAPYNPPEPYASMYDPADARLPAGNLDRNAGLPPQFRNAFTKFGGRVPPRIDPADPAPLRAFLTTIRALVRQIDDAIGNILHHVDLAQTLVFFTSDHGDYAGNRGVLRKAPWIPFDDLARVPFVVAGPGVDGGQRIAHLVQSSDFVPTALQYAGVDIDPRVLDTRTLTSLFATSQPAEADDRAVFSATTMGWPMVRHGRLKYIWHKGTWANVLFDLEQDPHETTNLSEEPEYRSDFEHLSALLDAALRRGQPELPGAVGP